MKSRFRDQMRALRHLLGWPFLDYNRKPSASALLAGKGRSGTSWMAEVVNYRKDYRYIFEPFHPSEVPAFRHLSPKKYVRPDAQDPEFLQLVNSVLRGKLKNEWTDYMYSNNSRWIYNKRLIKTIRAGLFLKWLKVNFPEVPIVLAVRHPCAVASSIINQDWMPLLSVLMEQEALVQDFLTPFVDSIDSAADAFEEHVFSWCIEYYVVFKQFEPGEIHLLFYEKLWEQPEKEIESLFGFLGKEYDSRAVEAIRRPSALTTRQSEQAIASGEEVLTKWQKTVTREQTKRCIDILGVFGLDRVYTDAPMPNVAGALELMEDHTL
jgi:hypothetical protein